MAEEMPGKSPGVGAMYVWQVWQPTHMMAPSWDRWELHRLGLSCGFFLAKQESGDNRKVTRLVNYDRDHLGKTPCSWMMQENRRDMIQPICFLRCSDRILCVLFKQLCFESCQRFPDSLYNKICFKL